MEWLGEGDMVLGIILVVLVVIGFILVVVGLEVVGVNYGLGSGLVGVGVLVMVVGAILVMVLYGNDSGKGETKVIEHELEDGTRILILEEDEEQKVIKLP